MHVIYIDKRQKSLGSSVEMMMAPSVTFSLWKLQYTPREGHSLCRTRSLFRQAGAEKRGCGEKNLI